MKEIKLLKFKWTDKITAPRGCICCGSMDVKKRTLTSGFEILPGEYFHLDFFCCRRCWRHQYPSLLGYFLGFIAILFAIFFIVGLLEGQRGLFLVGLAFLILIGVAGWKLSERNEARLLKQHPECAGRSLPVSIKGFEKGKWFCLGFTNQRVLDLMKSLNSELIIPE
jgi:hypothetical protein